MTLEGVFSRSTQRAADNFSSEDRKWVVKRVQKQQDIELDDFGSVEQNRAKLFSLAKLGKAAEINKLLPRLTSQQINAPDSQGRTPLDWALFKEGRNSCYLKTALLLIKKGGANIDHPDVMLGMTTLSWAAANGRNVMLRHLLDIKADPNACGTLSSPALTHAAIKGHMETVTSLLAAKANVNYLNPNGLTALDYAREKTTPNHEIIVGKLIEGGGVPKQI
jgi:uncharacterized protein